MLYIINNYNFSMNIPNVFEKYFRKIVNYKFCVLRSSEGNMHTILMSHNYSINNLNNIESTVCHSQFAHSDISFDGPN